MTAHIAEQLRHLAIPITSLVLDPSNARKHGERNLEAIKASLAKFGQRAPIVVQRDGMVVRSGNGRLLAAKALGWTEIAATIIDDDNATAAQFAIADNRTAELAEWDNETLALLLDGWDKETQEAVGFDKSDIEAVLADLEPPEIVEDEVPEPPVEPITKAGDMWLLGDHRLLCGDSTKAEDVKRLMAGEKADACVTDPPYGIGVDSVMHKQSGTQYGKAAAPKRNYAATDWDKLPPQSAIDNAAGFPQSIIFGGNYFNLPPARCWLVWDKENGNNAFADCELAWTNLDQPVRIKRHMWNGMIRKDKEERSIHPTQKPAGVMAWCVGMTDGLVYDPFLGSGTTLIAAEQLGRKCYGIEISPAYCDVIVKRWETLTGKKAVLANG